MKILKWFIVILILVTNVTIIKTSAQSIPFKKFTSEQGLIFDEVICSYSDTQGYLWFGTYAGLSKFNGKEFINFNNRNSNLQGTVIRDITEYQDMLVIGYTGGFAVLSKDNGFINYSEKDGLMGNDVLSLESDSNGIYILTDKGLNYLNGKNFKSYPIETDTAFFWKRLSIVNNKVYLISKKGLELFEDGKGESSFCLIGS